MAQPTRIPRRIVRRTVWPATCEPGEIDLASTASVWVSSEQAAFPIDNVFDGRGGPGGSCWMAAETGEQTIVLAFDGPSALRSLLVEVEERGQMRTQRIAVSFSRDGGASYEESLVREFSFAPYGATFEQENWQLGLENVTHLRVQISPNGPRARRDDARASLTSIVLR